MEFNIFGVYCIGIVLMTLVFFAFFAIKANNAFHDLGSNIGRIVGGSLVAGIGTGLLLGLLLACLLPTHFYVEKATKSGYSTKYALDANFFNEFGRRYVLNLTDNDLYFVGMTYGNKDFKEDDSPITVLQSGYMTQIDHDVDAWFQAFPDQVRTKEKGEIKWNVLTKSQTVTELKKIDVEIDL